MTVRRFVRFAALALAIVASCVALAGCGLFEPPRPPLTFAPAALPNAYVGVAYDTTITVSGNVTPVGSISATPSALPPGLTLRHERGRSFATISGTPTAAGRYAFVLDAWCLGTNVTGQTGSRGYGITVDHRAGNDGGSGAGTESP